MSDCCNNHDTTRADSQASRAAAVRAAAAPRAAPGAAGARADLVRQRHRGRPPPLAERAHRQEQVSWLSFTHFLPG